MDSHFRAKSVPLDELTNTLTSQFAKTALLQLGQNIESEEEDENESPKQREETEDESETQDEEEGSPMFQGEFVVYNDEKQLSVPSKQSLVTYTHLTEEKKRRHFEHCDTF